MKAINASIFLGLAFLVIPGFIAQGAVVSLDDPLTNLSSGQTLDVGVIIDPQGTPVAGVQLDVEYDVSATRLNGIVEGDLLKQDGAGTLFNSGLIDNARGRAGNIYGAILGPTSVKTQGTFIIMNITVTGTSFGTNINLSNILVVGPQGEQVYPVPTPAPANNGQEISGAGSGGASGGGGAGGASGENYTNIEYTEKYDRSIYRDATTSYRFRKPANPIIFVNITGNTNSIDITTLVEVLKGTSTLVKNPPVELVYRNINIWVGTFGYATSKNIKHAEITFKVPIEWMEANNIDPESIELIRYEDGWQSLPTRSLGAYKDHLLYEADTTGFSEFAITGKTAAGRIDFRKYVESVPASNIGIPLMEEDEKLPELPEKSAGIDRYLLAAALAGITTNSFLLYKIRGMKKK